MPDLCLDNPAALIAPVPVTDRREYRQCVPADNLHRCRHSMTVRPRASLAMQRWPASSQILQVTAQRCLARH